MSNRETLLKRAASMRRNPTEPERRLWMALRNSRLDSHEFRRQVLIGNRILDFLCPKKRLAIEVDGDTHDPVIDQVRDEAVLRAHGIRVIRFTNHEVMENQAGVLQAILSALDEQPDRWAS